MQKKCKMKRNVEKGQNEGETNLNEDMSSSEPQHL